MVCMEQERHGFRNLVRVILISLLAVTAVIILVVFFNHRKAYRDHHATFPDGSSVKLLGVSIGDAQFTTDTKWQRLAPRPLPGALQYWVPPVRTGPITQGASNTIKVLLRFENPSLKFPSWNIPWEAVM